MVRAWYMDSSEEDQRLEHHRKPPHFLDVDELFKVTGVEYFKVSTTFDVITSFSAVYIWSWTTAQSNPRTVTRGP